MSFNAPSKPTPQGVSYFPHPVDRLLWRMGLGFRWIDEDGVLVYRGTRWYRRRQERKKAEAAAAKQAKEEAKAAAAIEEEIRQKARAYDPANWNGTNTRQWQALDFSLNSYNQEVHPLCKSTSRSLRTIVLPDPKTAPDPIPSEPAWDEQPQRQETADEASSDDQRMQKRPGEISSMTSVTESARSSAAGGDSFSKAPEALRKISKSAGSISQLRVDSKLMDQLAEQSEVAC